MVAICLAATAAATAAVTPHYLAYFNTVSGGPAHGSEHLIDSNLDWGQDLVGLKRWPSSAAPPGPAWPDFIQQIRSPTIFSSAAG